MACKALPAFICRVFNVLLKPFKVLFMTFSENSNRNHLIDLLRVLAASWVALCHFNVHELYIDNWYRLLCSKGVLGVPMFFVISGYCISIASNHSKSARDFIVRRFFRIMPVYWFSLIITLVCILLVKLIYGVNGVQVMPKTFTNVMAIITLTTSPLSNLKNINWVYWTLTYEVFFYLLIFVKLLLPNKIQLPWLITLTVLSILLPFQKSGILFFINQWSAFCVGLALYNILHKKEHLAANLLLLVLCIVGLFNTDQPNDYIITCIITTVVIFLNHLKPIRQNLLSKYGDVSYAIYLTHVPVGIYLFNYIKSLEYLQKSIFFNILTDMLLLLCVFLVSLLIHQQIEVRAIKIGKSLAKKLG
jgi:peptidoglycan/LPS O-acetylase OafA/YrhL